MRSGQIHGRNLLRPEKLTDARLPFAVAGLSRRHGGYGQHSRSWLYGLLALRGAPTPQMAAPKADAVQKRRCEHSCWLLYRRTLPAAGVEIRCRKVNLASLRPPELQCPLL